MIALVDYGAGNLTSVRKAFAAAGSAVVRVSEAAALDRADAVVIPGVGHFGATRRLDAAWRSAIAGAVRRGAPLLGICLGMQWLFDGSAEAPGLPGLGMIRGTCVHLGTVEGGKVPHIGWNQVRLTRASRILEGVADGAFVYFTHSFAAPLGADVVASTAHGRSFAAAIEIGGVAGVQFHPEKSGEAGLTVLRNFLRLAGAR